MPRPKIAIPLTSVRLPFRQALLAAKKLGASAVEIDARGELKPGELTGTALRQVRKLISDLELKVAAVEFRTRRGYDVGTELERRVEATKEAMTFARSLECGLVVNRIGQISEDVASRSFGTLKDVLTDLGVHGQRAGALLAAETGGESAADLARLMAAVPRGSFMIALNPGEMVVNGFAPLEVVATLGGDIGYVRAKDGVRDLARGRGVEVPLGRGESDFPALVGALEAHDYRGYLCVARETSTDPMTELSQSVQYLRAL